MLKDKDCKMSIELENVIDEIIEIVIKMDKDKFVCTDYDLDRVYLTNLDDGFEYMIRMWNLTETFVDCTVFKYGGDNKEYRGVIYF